MAAKSVPARELDTLHQRIGDAIVDLRARVRRQTTPGPRPDEVFRAASEALRGLGISPGVVAGLGAALLAVAGVTAALHRRRPGTDRSHPGAETL